MKKNSFKWLRLIPSILFLCTQISSNINAQKNLNISFDLIQFGYDSESNFIEVYYSVYGENSPDNKLNHADYLTLYLNFQVTDSISKSVVFSKKYLINKEIDFVSDKDKHVEFVGVKRILLSAGNYQFLISVTDEGSNKLQPDFVKHIIVLPFKKKSVSISEIQFASNIIRKDTLSQSIFYKNNYEVIPNIPRVYLPEMPVLFYYLEMYNLNLTSDTLLYIEKILNSNRRREIENSRRFIPGKNSVVFVNRLDISGLESGTYFLEIELEKSDGESMSSTSGKFYLYNLFTDSAKSEYITDNYLGSEYAYLSPEECDREFDWVTYIASTDEIKIYSGLSQESAKKKFLYDFWLKRDPVPETVVNESKNIYLRRVNFCNANFKLFGKPGYKTDRGRIYLTYGEYDTREAYFNEVNKKPYIIWSYDRLEGGVIFVFADLNGFGNFELIHSTMRGELKDPNWMKRVLIN